MSMCFLYNDVLYADCFQIHDYENFAPSLTDNKIFISESGNVVIAIMGNVPENIPDILERLERGYEVWKSDIKAKKDLDSSTLTFDQIITNIDVDMLAIFRTSAKKYFSLVTAAGYSGKRVVNHSGDKEQARLFTPSFVFAMLDAGMTPAQVFKGVSQYKGTISKEFTAYDLKKKKFI
jgi:hypothetical protein